MAHLLSYLRWLMPLLAIIVAGCDRSQPKNINNACAIYREFPGWREIGKRVQRRWGTPPSLQLAIIYTESRFKPMARPRREFLHIFNKSSARGYAQALDAVWRRYVHATHQLAADRTNFADASNFIGWYTHITKKRFGVSYKNGVAHYLAFHEGWGGFSRGSYRKQPKLLRIARKTQQKALLYHMQLLRCHSG